MARFKLTNEINDDLFKFKFNYKFFTKENDNRTYVRIYKDDIYLLTIHINDTKKVKIPILINELGIHKTYKKIMDKYINMENKINNNLDEDYIEVPDTLEERVKYCAKNDSLICIRQHEFNGKLMISDYNFYGNGKIILSLYYDYSEDLFIFTYEDVKTGDIKAVQTNENYLGKNLERECMFSEENSYPIFLIKCTVKEYEKLYNFSSHYIDEDLRDIEKDIMWHNDIKYIISNKDLNDISYKNKQYDVLTKYLYLYFRRDDSLDIEEKYDFYKLQYTCNERNKLNYDMKKDGEGYFVIYENSDTYFLTSNGSLFDIYKTVKGNEIYYSKVCFNEYIKDCTRFAGSHKCTFYEEIKQPDILITSDNRIFLKYKIQDKIKDNTDDIIDELTKSIYNNFLIENENNVIVIENEYDENVIYVDYEKAQLQLNENLYNICDLINAINVDEIKMCFDDYIEEIGNFVQDFNYRNSGYIEKAIKRFSNIMTFEEDVLDYIYKENGMEMYYKVSF